MNFEMILLGLSAAALVVSVLVTLFLLYSAYGVIAGAPYVPSKDYKLAVMMEMAAIKSGEVVYDLGSGDGRLVRLAAKAGAEAHGFEVNLFLHFIGRWLNARAGCASRAHLHLQNFYTADFRKADVVFIYLFPKPMRHLEQRLRASMKPGARVVVSAFPFPNWQPEEIRGHTYRYRI